MNRHRALALLFEHDLFGKPVSIFPDHALAAHDAPRLSFSILTAYLNVYFLRFSR